MNESVPFILSLASVYFYGKRGLIGPIAGCVCAFSFIIFGLTSGIYAASVSNVIFMWLHFNNGLKIMNNDQERTAKKIAKSFQCIQDAAHSAAKLAGWWTDLATGEDKTKTKNFNVGEKLCLIHSEISEAMEGDRKNLMDDKLPHRKMIEVELADAVIRIGDLSGAMGLDVAGAIAEKMAFNAIRPDHKVDNRKKAGGKAY